MIKDRITQELQEALKKGDALRVSTFRLLSNALHNEEIAKQEELAEEEETGVVRRQLKQREEAVEALRQAQGKLTSSSKADIEARIEKERKEAEILKEFLPAQMSEEELGGLVDRLIGELGASSQADFGKVMGAVMTRVAGRADGKIVAQVVQQKLNQIGL